MIAKIKEAVVLESPHNTEVQLEGITESQKRLRMYARNS